MGFADNIAKPGGKFTVQLWLVRGTACLIRMASALGLPTEAQFRRGLAAAINRSWRMLRPDASSGPVCAAAKSSSPMGSATGFARIAGEPVMQLANRSGPISPRA